MNTAARGSARAHGGAKFQREGDRAPWQGVWLSGASSGRSSCTRGGRVVLV